MSHFNPNEIMEGYQKSDRDSTWMPGIGDYFKKIIEQNNKIIAELEKINQHFKGKL